MVLPQYGFNSIIRAVPCAGQYFSTTSSRANFRPSRRGLQDELLAHAVLLREFGPGLGRPSVDTLNGSKHANMKELRFGWGREVWRVAFAFDPKRQAVLLVARDKGGAGQKRFYKRLIDVADSRFDAHLASLAAAAASKEK